MEKTLLPAGPSSVKIEFWADLAAAADAAAA